MAFHFRYIYRTPLTRDPPCRKNIFVAASNAAVEQQLPGAEALRSKSVSINPINITSADLRSPSNVSAMSMSGIDNGGGAGMLDSFDGHVPHLLCKLTFLVPP